MNAGEKLRGWIDREGIQDGVRCGWFAKAEASELSKAASETLCNPGVGVFRRARVNHESVFRSYI